MSKPSVREAGGGTVLPDGKRAAEAYRPGQKQHSIFVSFAVDFSTGPVYNKSAKSRKEHKTC